MMTHNSKKTSRRLIILLFVFLMPGMLAFAATRTWTGAVNNDFNNGSNYTPTGAILATDDLVFNFTATVTYTVSVTANITINNLTFTVNNGDAQVTLNTGTSVLTINGTSSFNAQGFNNPTHYDILYIDVMTNPSGILFNGTTSLHTTGSGITYLQGTAVNPGYVKFKSNVTWGTNLRTQPGIEPDMLFDAAVSQTITCNNTYFVMAEDFDFGVTNSPTVTFAGATANQARTYSYDGNIRINNTTVVQAMNASLDRYVATAGGSFIMSAGSRIEVNYANSFPGYNAGNVYGTYSMNATSTQIFLGTASTQNIPGLTYGYLTAGGTGNKTATGNCIVQSNFTVNSGSTYLGSTYSHQLYGHFINNGTFTANTCTWTLNGTGNQNIQGSVSSTFYNLVVNKSTGNAYLQINTTVGTSATTGQMHFQAGPLYLNGYTLTVAVNAAAGILRTSGYAVSENNVAVNPSIITWNMGTTTGSHVYPFGDASANYIPLTFNKTTGTASNISVSTRHSTMTDNTPWAGASNVAAVGNMYDYILNANGSIPVVIDRWWDITASAAVTANVTFSYLGTENTLSAPYNTGNLGAQHWNGTAWDPPVGSAVAVSSGVGTVTANGLNTFSPWVLSSIAAPLPVELLGFDGTCVNGNVQLSWQTATETDNKSFTIDRTEDGVNYTTIAVIDGAGTSTQPNLYSFSDPGRITATTYYRLRQTDVNGRTETLDIISVEPCEGDDHIDVFAFASDIVILMNLESAQQYRADIYDATGRLVYNASLAAKEGANRFDMNSAVVAQGVYIVVLTGADGKQFSQKIIVQ